MSGDVHGFYGELEAILDQFPYQHWYVACVVREAKKILGPKEAEGLADLPEAERQEKTQKVVTEAQPGCEKTERPTVDPNASSKEVELLRSSTAPGIVGLAESNGMSSTQVACVQSFFAETARQESDRTPQRHRQGPRSDPGLGLPTLRPAQVGGSVGRGPRSSRSDQAPAPIWSLRSRARPRSTRRVISASESARTGPGSAGLAPTNVAFTPSLDRQRGQLTSFTM